MRTIFVCACIVAAGGYFGSKWLLHHKVENGVDTAIVAMSPIVTIEYDGVSSTMSGELTIDGIRARIAGFEDDIRIGRLGIDTPSYFALLDLSDASQNVRRPDEMIPKSFGIIAEGVEMRVDADFMHRRHEANIAELNATDANTPAAQCAGKYGFSPQALLGLGYTTHVSSASLHFRRGDGTYSIDIAADVDDMGSMSGEVVLDGDMASELSKGSRFRPRLKSMRFEIEDKSLNERTRKYCASLGLSEEQILEAQLNSLQFFGEQLGIVFDEYVLSPYTEYLNGKSTLIVVANPSEPISLTQIGLYKPSDVPALLELSAEAY